MAAATDSEQQAHLRRVRSFTTRSGAVINRGDSFKVRGGRRHDGDGESLGHRHVAAAAAAYSGVDSATSRRSYSPVASSRLRDADVTIVVSGDEVTSHTVLVLGSHGVGKTTVTQQLLTSEYLANKDYNVGQSVTSLSVIICVVAV